MYMCHLLMVIICNVILYCNMVMIIFCMYMGVCSDKFNMCVYCDPPRCIKILCYSQLHKYILYIDWYVTMNSSSENVFLNAIYIIII